MRRVRKTHLLSSFQKKIKKHLEVKNKMYIFATSNELKKNIMNKFKKLVELAKDSVENSILQEVEFDKTVFLPTNGKDLILFLDGEWYFDMLLKAGYKESTIDRKFDNMDFDKLASALDDWYKTEIYPKLYNKFQSEGRKILDY